MIGTINKNTILSIYQDHKTYCHLMIIGEKLPFRAADSNKYIGRIPITNYQLPTTTGWQI